MYSITEIEDKIIEALTPLAAPASYVKTLRTFQSTLMEALESPKESVIKFPVILVVFAGNEYRESPGDVYNQLMYFNIYCGTEGLRSEASRRHGDQGIYQMLADVREKLAGNRLGLQIAPLSIIREEPEYVGKIRSRTVSIYSATYKTELDYAAPTVQQ